jgi:DNA-directed RNA polymerase specialized sigma subunit
MATTTTRTLDDRVAGIVRQIQALTRDGSEWDPSAMILIQVLKGAVDEARDRAVYAMRDHGTTDSEIAQALGVSQQAVSKRWPGGGRYVGAAGRYRQPKGA